MDRVQLMGYVASAIVLATFCMNTMWSLRLAAIGSNITFLIYGAVAGVYPVLALHLLLLPVNLLKFHQLQRMTGRIHAVKEKDIPIEALMPFMREVKAAAGTVLFNKGDTADGLYYIASGSVGIEEYGVTCEAGSVVGEMGVFSPSRLRTATAVCRTDCILYRLSAVKAKELYFQNPEFGFGVLCLIMARLSDNRESRAAVIG